MRNHLLEQSGAMPATPTTETCEAAGSGVVRRGSALRALGRLCETSPPRGSVGTWLMITCLRFPLAFARIGAGTVAGLCSRPMGFPPGRAGAAMGWNAESLQPRPRLACPLLVVDSLKSGRRGPCRRLAFEGQWLADRLGWPV